MASVSYKIPQEICSGGKRQTWGYWTSTGSTATVEIYTGLNYVHNIEIQPYISSGVLATECAVEETFPKAGEAITINYTANSSTPVVTYGYWFATGI